MKWLGTLLATIALEGTVLAGGCGYSCYRSYSYSAPVYTPPVVVTTFVPFFAYVPVGFASYVPTVAAPAVQLNPTLTIAAAPATVLPPAQAALPVVPTAPAVAADPCAARLAPLMARIDALEAKLGAKAAQEKLPPPKEEKKAEQIAAPQNILAVLKTNCASCHDKAEAGKVVQGSNVHKGGDFVLTDGDQIVKLDDKAVRAIYKNLLKGAMPPPPAKLTDADGQALLSWLDGLK